LVCEKLLEVPDNEHWIIGTYSALNHSAESPNILPALTLPAERDSVLAPNLEGLAGETEQAASEELGTNPEGSGNN
jgi:hypothetical protein